MRIKMAKVIPSVPYGQLKERMLGRLNYNVDFCFKIIL